MAIFEIPTALQKFVAGKRTIEIECATVGEGLEQLDLQFPNFKRHVVNEVAQIRRYVSIFTDTEDIRYLDGLDTEVGKENRIKILIANAGG